MCHFQNVCTLYIFMLGHSPEMGWGKVGLLSTICYNVCTSDYASHIITCNHDRFQPLKVYMIEWIDPLEMNKP